MLITKKEIKNSKRLIYALIATNIFIFLSSFEFKIGFPQIFKYLASVFALYNIFIFFWRAERLKIRSVFITPVLFLFVAVSIYLLITGIRFEKFFIQEFFAEKSFYVPYLIPLIFLNIKFSIIAFKKILFVTYIWLPFALLSLIFCFIFPGYFNYPYNAFFVLSFAFANSLLLYVSHLLRWKYVTPLTLIYHIFFLVLMAINGRRGETLEQLLPLLIFVFIRIGSSSISQAKKIVLVAISTVFLIVSGLYVNSVSDRVLLFERGLSKEGFDNTRKETVINFLYDFGSRPNDYIIGRGLNGTVRKWLWASEEKRFSRTIEIGYFNILLKGGYLYLIPMMFLFFSSFYLGLFRSRNDLVKGLSFLVLWQIIYMVSFGMAMFSVYYFMVWIAVSACLNKDLRLMDNKYLSKVFNSK